MSQLEAVGGRQVQPAGASDTATTRLSPPFVKHRDPTTSQSKISDVSIGKRDPSQHNLRTTDDTTTQSRHAVSTTGRTSRSLLHTNHQPAVHAWQPLQQDDGSAITSSAQNPLADSWRAQTSYHDRPMGDQGVYTQVQGGSIPAIRHLPYVEHGPTTIKQETTRRLVPSSTYRGPVSLPSFAVFRESAQARPAGEHDTAVAATTPSLDDAAPCICSRLSPLIQTAARCARQLALLLNLHVVELGDDPALDAVEGDPVTTLQHLTDRLVAAQRSISHHSANYPAALCLACKARSGERERSTFPNKREADSNLLGCQKRPRLDSDSDLDHPAETSRALLYPLQVAQAAPQEGQGSLLLPSPASLVNHTPQYTTSRPGASPSPPTTIYKTESSLHNVTTSAAASQHIADLEHQVTLKSLSLQSLQTEHTNLMQKWHRERVKMQTVEKKCQAADAEINELAARNDELIEQMKSLETQLLELEQRRKVDVDHASREKDQWVRMLEQSGRLQQSVHAECHRLKEENSRLDSRLKRCSNCSVNYGRLTAEPEALATQDEDRPQQRSAIWSPAMINALQAQVNDYRAAFEDAKQQNDELEASFKQADGLRQSLSKAIEKALDGFGSVTSPAASSAITHVPEATAIAPNEEADTNQATAQELRLSS